jgi:hypothetical protein
VLAIVLFGVVTVLGYAHVGPISMMEQSSGSRLGGSTSSGGSSSGSGSSFGSSRTGGGSSD